MTSSSSLRLLMTLGFLLTPACVGQVTGVDGLGSPQGADDALGTGTGGDGDDRRSDDDGDAAGVVGDGDAGLPGDHDEPVQWPPGEPGCGLAAAAFCDTFDAPAAAPRGRSFELDATRWSLARNEPTLGKPNEIGQGSVSQCRSDVPAEVLPPGDTRICAGNEHLQSAHLLTVTAAQNYGSNAYRIRQPFDFAGRTGTIVFDADATSIGLLGWIAIAVTEDPVPSPSFSVIPGAGNFEGGVIPKNGLSVELSGACPGGTKLVMVNEYRDYVDYLHDEASLESGCIAAMHHRLNRITIRLSQTHLEVWATPYSDDGVTFGTASLITSVDVALQFTRGYVHLVARNHATEKYWTAANPADSKAAWVVRWDNVGFDGPVIDNTREFEVPDALVPAPDNSIAVGYMLGDASAATRTTLTIENVSGSAQAVRARLAMDVHYFGNFTNANLATWGLTYRLNGHAWRTYDLTPQEESLYLNGVQLEGAAAGSQNALVIGVIGHVFDIDPEDLIDGDNVLELATVDVGFAGYPPTLGNVDLILTH